MFQLEMYKNHKSNLILFSIGALVTLSLLVFPSTNMIAYSQSGNQTQGNDQAQQKLFELTQKFNKILKDSNVNLTLPQGEELSSKLQVLAKSAAFKSLSEKLIQAVQELKTNMTNLGNDTTAIGDLSQDAGTNFTQLIQKLEELKDNP